MSYTSESNSAAQNPGSRAVTAFFDSPKAVAKAKADLIAAGLSSGSIQVVGSGGPTADTGPGEGGFWHALKEFFIPDEDRFTYAEGLRRGGYALSVNTGDAHYDRVLDILDADGAVDIDEREQNWRSEGWLGYQPDRVSDDLAFSHADNGTAGFGASRAGDDGYAPDTVTAPGTTEAESRGDTDRVGTGAGEPGLLNPDMRERIGSGTASMTPATPTGSQDATLNNNAANVDRGTPVGAGATSVGEATLGKPNRLDEEAVGTVPTIGNLTPEETRRSYDVAERAYNSRRDEGVRRGRVRGFIVDPADKAQSGL